MIQRLSATLFCAAIIGCAAAPAYALNTRTWISGAGVDQAGCGPIANPCRTLQYAHDSTAAGGEIDVKDSAGYGSVVINKAISIVGDGSLAGVLATSGSDAITINAGSSDLVVLRGLTIEGAGVAYNGIIFNSGGKLDISKCVIQGFVFNSNLHAGRGLFFAPTSGNTVLSVVDTTVSHNGFLGIYCDPTGTASASISMDHVTAIDNAEAGIVIDSTASSGTAKASISNALASSNGVYGFGFSGYNTSVTIAFSNGSNNGAYGLYTNSGTVSSLKNNLFTGNGTGPVFGTISAATAY